MFVCLVMAKARMVAGIVALFLLFSFVPAQASPWKEHVLGAASVGSARMSYLWWDVYDIHLYATDGRWSADKPFALRLDYLMSLKGDKIAERSIKEMRKLGMGNDEQLRNWFVFMSNTFPDVQEGDSLIGVRDSGGKTVFFSGERQLGEIVDADFSHYFFGIWLHEDTSEPSLRKKLLGGN